jgi:hypothetical protein
VHFLKMLASTMRDELKVIVIAGPNGAGKTTFAREFLPSEADCPVFVNADLIAAGLSPFAPDTAALQAGRLMLAKMARHFAARESFAFETTLAGHNYIRHIRDWQAAGYRVKLISRRRRSGGALPQALRTSNTSTLPWWTLGRSTTTRALSRGC